MNKEFSDEQIKSFLDKDFRSVSARIAKQIKLENDSLHIFITQLNYQISQLQQENERLKEGIYTFLPPGVEIIKDSDLFKILGNPNNTKTE